jgi:hypothetical protein
VNLLNQSHEIQLIDFGSGSHIISDNYADFDGKKCFSKMMPWAQGDQMIL